MNGILAIVLSALGAFGITALLGNFLNNIRLRTNNGWTPDELFANSSVQNANAPFVRTHPTVGRNAPCPCGSGKKYKKCCGKL